MIAAPYDISVKNGVEEIGQHRDCGMKFFNKRISLPARRQLRLEIARVQSKLDIMPKQCVIVAGNALLGKDIESMVPGQTLDINSQVSSIHSYANILDKLKFKAPARLAILVLDLSDANHSSSPDDVAIDKFDCDTRKLIARLQQHSVDVLVSYISPAKIRDANIEGRIPAVYSISLEKSCKFLGVRFFDDFRFWRHGQTESDESIFDAEAEDISRQNILASIRNYIRVHYRVDNIIGKLPGFDSSYYEFWYPDTLKYPNGMAHHYIDVGWTEGRDPCGHFSTDGYLIANPDVRASGICPLVHFLEIGLLQGRTGWQKMSTNPTRYEQFKK